MGSAGGRHRGSGFLHAFATDEHLWRSWTLVSSEKWRLYIPVIYECSKISPIAIIYVRYCRHRDHFPGFGGECEKRAYGIYHRIRPRSVLLLHHSLLCNPHNLHDPLSVTWSFVCGRIEECAGWICSKICCAGGRVFIVDSIRDLDMHHPGIVPALQVVQRIQVGSQGKVVVKLSLIGSFAANEIHIDEAFVLGFNLPSVLAGVSKFYFVVGSA